MTERLSVDLGLVDEVLATVEGEIEMRRLVDEGALAPDAAGVLAAAAHHCPPALAELRPWSINWALSLRGVINVSAGRAGEVVFTVRSDTPKETYDLIELHRPSNALVRFDARGAAT